MQLKDVKLGRNFVSSIKLHVETGGCGWLSRANMKKLTHLLLSSLWLISGQWDKIEGLPGAQQYGE